MIGYCPLEEETPTRVPQIRNQSARPKPLNSSRMEDTETNYVVLFFIAGVFALAAMDSIKK